MKKFTACGCDDGTSSKPENGNLFFACSNALIAAKSAVVPAEILDIGSCYIGDILEQAETHIRILNLPEYVIPISMVVFGHPTSRQGDHKQLNRFPQDKIVFENTYRDLSDEQLQGFAADHYIEAFYKRKHISDFANK